MADFTSTAYASPNLDAQAGFTDFVSIIYDSGGGDGGPVPYVQNAAPASMGLGVPLTASQPFSFELIGHRPFRRVVVMIKYPGLVFTEVVWIGSTDDDNVVTGAFTARYLDTSTAAGMVDGTTGLNGVAFTILRDPVWPDAPQLELVAVQQNGEEI